MKDRYFRLMCLAYKMCMHYDKKYNKWSARYNKWLNEWEKRHTAVSVGGAKCKGL